MKKASDYVKEAEAESLKVLNEVNKDFVIGYLSASVAILESGGVYRKGFNDGYDAGFACAEIASRSTKKLADQDSPAIPSSDLAHPKAGEPSVIQQQIKAGYDVFDQILADIQKFPGTVTKIR